MNWDIVIAGLSFLFGVGATSISWVMGWLDRRDKSKQKTFAAEREYLHLQRNLEAHKELLKLLADEVEDVKTSLIKIENYLQLIYTNRDRN